MICEFCGQDISPLKQKLKSEPGQNPTGYRIMSDGTTEPEYESISEIVFHNLGKDYHFYCIMEAIAKISEFIKAIKDSK